MCPLENDRRLLIVAHRGARIEAPENTAAAFSRALSYPVDGVETDVQMSKDGVPVLFHDRTLKKLGLKRRVSDLNWREIARLDAGSWHAAKYAGERLPALEPMLDMMAGRTRLLIEIKVFAADRRSGRARTLTDKVLQALGAPRRAGFRDSVQLLSFDPETLRYASGIDAGLKTVLDVSKADARRLKKSSPNMMAHLHAFCVHTGGITRALVDWAHDLGKQVFGYTCNDSATLKKMTAAGVDGVLTDDPAWLCEEREKKMPKMP